MPWLWTPPNHCMSTSSLLFVFWLSSFLTFLCTPCEGVCVCVCLHHCSAEISLTLSVSCLPSFSSSGFCLSLCVLRFLTVRLKGCAPALHLPAHLHATYTWPIVPQYSVLQAEMKWRCGSMNRDAFLYCLSPIYITDLCNQIQPGWQEVGSSLLLLHSGFPILFKYSCFFKRCTGSSVKHHSQCLIYCLMISLILISTLVYIHTRPRCFNILGECVETLI